MFAERILGSERASDLLPKDLHLYRHLPYALELDDQIVRTRDNALITCFEITGPDGLTSSPEDLIDLRLSVARMFEGLDDRFSFYIHRLMRGVSFDQTPPLDDSFEAAVGRRWREHLTKQGLHEHVIVMSIVRAPATPIKLPLISWLAKKAIAEHGETQLAELKEFASIFQTGLDIKTKPLSIADGTLLGFFAAINTGILEPLARGTLSLIAEDVATISPRFQDGVIEIPGGIEGTRYAALLVVKTWPNATFPGMLDTLDASINTVICHSFTPIHLEQISERAVRRVMQMQASADVAETVKTDLLLAADAVESGTLGFGDHQFSITVFAESRKALEVAIGQISGVAAQARFKMIRDTTTLEASYFAAHPGNMDYRCHDIVTSSLNMADLASFHMSEVGTPGNQLPWHKPITLFPTISGSAHRFSFHAPGNPDQEPTNGHTLVLGPSGSGKTLLTGFLTSQARLLGARVFMFDKDNGLKLATKAMGGNFAEVRAGQPTGLNPLSSEIDTRGQDWLLRWMISLLEGTGTPLTPQQSAKLRNAIRQNAEAPEDLRNFAAFQDLIGDVGDARDLARRIAEWSPSGRYGWVFAPSEHPLVDYASNPVTTIDLTEILSAGTERTAVLAYLFRRIEVLMEDRSPTIIVIDEAWQVLDDDYFRKTLEKWLVTARKKNTVVIMLTQFPGQIRASKAGSIMEALPNQLIFPNRKAQAADYDGLGLNDAELSYILAGASDERSVLLRGHAASTILNVDLAALGKLMTPFTGHANDAIDPNLWRTP